MEYALIVNAWKIQSLHVLSQIYLEGTVNVCIHYLTLHLSVNIAFISNSSDSTQLGDTHTALTYTRVRDARIFLAYNILFTDFILAFKNTNPVILFIYTHYLSIQTSLFRCSCSV